MAIWTTPRRSTIPTGTPARDDHVTDPGEPPRRTTSVSCPDAPTSHGPGITGSWNNPKPEHSDGPAPPHTPTPSNPTPSPSQRSSQSQRSSTRRQPTTPRRSDHEGGGCVSERLLDVRWLEERIGTVERRYHGGAEDAGGPPGARGEFGGVNHARVADRDRTATSGELSVPLGPDVA